MVSKYLYCGELGISPIQFITACGDSRSNMQDWSEFSERNVTLTYQGRGAIALVCKLLHIMPNDEIIVPAYNCGTEIDPFVQAGARVIFYRVDDHAKIDLEDIIRRVTPSTRLIYVTHYFGWPQEINALATWCEQRGLFLLEDCALSLFSKGPNNTIGQIGNAAVYSFVKSLPVPDGGALVLKNIDFRNVSMSLTPPRHLDIICNSLPLFKKWFMHKNKFWQNYEVTRKLLNKSWLRKPVNQDCSIQREMPKNYYFDAQKINWSISKWTNVILNKIDHQEIIEKRRHNYQYLHNTLRNIPSLQLLFNELPNDVCPLSFPVFVKDRKHWCNTLNNYGIIIGEWWAGYHRNFDWKEFPEACHLKNDLLTLPVHQGLKLEHMKYITECVHSIAESHDHYHSR